jgi:hypothetical protein
VTHQPALCPWCLFDLGTRPFFFKLSLQNLQIAKSTWQFNCLGRLWPFTGLFQGQVGVCPPARQGWCDGVVSPELLCLLSLRTDLG